MRPTFERSRVKIGFESLSNPRNATVIQSRCGSLSFHVFLAFRARWTHSRHHFRLRRFPDKRFQAPGLDDPKFCFGFWISQRRHLNTSKPSELSGSQNEITTNNLCLNHSHLLQTRFLSTKPCLLVNRQVVVLFVDPSPVPDMSGETRRMRTWSQVGYSELQKSDLAWCWLRQTSKFKRGWISIEKLLPGKLPS